MRRSKATKRYLIAYNLFQSFGWCLILIKTVRYIIGNEGKYGIGKGVPGLHEVARTELRIFQTLACLEIIHCIVGIISSSAVLTFFQLYSRVSVVWGLPDCCMNQSIGLLLALVGWSVTEVIRYIYYACLLIGSTPYIITYLRYTLFFVLYPAGVLGEQIMVYTAFPIVHATKQWSVSLPNPWNFAFSYYYYGMFGIMLYLSVFPQLYGYMINQRRKALHKEKDD